jgi:hypothetical protein
MKVVWVLRGWERELLMSADDQIFKSQICRQPGDLLRKGRWLLVVVENLES